jgi:hypothetical protein
MEDMAFLGGQGAGAGFDLEQDVGSRFADACGLAASLASLVGADHESMGKVTVIRLPSSGAYCKDSTIRLCRRLSPDRRKSDVTA